MTTSFDGEFYPLQLLSQTFSPKTESRGENREKLNFGAYIPIQNYRRGVAGASLLYFIVYWSDMKPKKKFLSSQKAQFAILCVPQAVGLSRTISTQNYLYNIRERTPFTNIINNFKSYPSHLLYWNQRQNEIFAELLHKSIAEERAS